MKHIVWPRAKLVVLTSFFTFTFAIMFLALVQNYAQAGVSSLLSTHGSAVIENIDAQYPINHQVIPSFGIQHHIAGFDFDTDDSYQKYLHTDHPFNDSAYAPTDLLPIDSNFTANNARAFTLRQEAGTQFADMAWHFRKAFSGDKLYISSAYRSMWLQDYLIKQWCALVKCAPTGTSEHQAWLAVDLKIVAKSGKSYSLDVTSPNKYADWLKINAARFGFHNTYQKWVEVDGKIVEWRHRRYLWIPLATLLSDNDQTFAEYYTSITN